MTEMVDWDLAVATAARMVRPGPVASRAEVGALVADLRRFAGEAEGHVGSFTGLEAAGGGPVLVVDRPGWARANAEGLRSVLTPLGDRLEARRGSAPLGTIGAALGPRLTAIEAGALLAFLAGKVLGQYDLFADGDRPGRLLLVAPNVLEVERRMRVDPRDFRLWVCLHEETHRTQFTAVPWLRDHVRSEVRSFVDETDVDPSAVLRRLVEGLSAIAEAIRGQGERSLLDVVQTPRQREVVERLTALMSLLEGHADYVMDGVGPTVIPSVAVIRRRFQRRRRSTGPVDRAIRNVIGVEAKMRQYRDGERFVRAVVGRVGMAGFNRVWTSPATLPTGAEITDPAAWVRRVHGGEAAQ